MATGDCFREAFNELQRMEDEGENDIVLLPWRRHQRRPEDDAARLGRENRRRERVRVRPRQRQPDPSNPDAYYRRFMPTNVVRYEPQAALMEYTKSMHHGPWDKIFDGMG